jgi:selenocysteine lyase/cysteine desulfurase
MSRVHNGFPVAYLDGPGGTQVPASVADAMCDYLLNHNANTHWAYPTSVETDALIAAARAALADFLNASADEIAFGANMTTLTFHLSRALARAGARATRSSSPSSITTRTWIHGGRLRVTHGWW